MFQDQSMLFYKMASLPSWASHGYSIVISLMWVYTRATLKIFKTGYLNAK